jgi:hypothetical protein
MAIRTRPVTKEYEDGWERTFGRPAARREALWREFTERVQAKLAEVKRERKRYVQTRLEGVDYEYNDEWRDGA